LTFPRVLPLGDAAATVELGDRLDSVTNARVQALDRDLVRAPFDGLRETVPTHRSLLVLYDPRAAAFAAVRRELLARTARATGPPPLGRRHEIPTVYGGEHGPDLAELARARGLSEADALSLHCSQEYTAFMLGFTPGFAYLGVLPEALDAPRRSTPRVRVPAGSVAIAGRQTAIYPVASPGGWQLVGRTSVRLFDPFRAEPALFAPGDHVRFVPAAELPPPEPARPAPRSEGPVALEVLEAGLLTTVQGAARVGHRRFGVSGAGPMDVATHAAANRAVGNPEGAAGLECTVVGPSLSFLALTRFAVAGADLGAVLERTDLGPWPVPLGAAVLARPGNVLRFTGRRSGCRAYVAFRGGIDVPLVLGSRACDLQGGFGGLEGRALAAGDRLALGPATSDAVGHDQRPAPCGSPATVRVVLGPQEDQIEPESEARFLATAWRVGPTSDRVGCRLDGPALRHSGSSEVLSDGMVPGSIQVPPDGQPIVMMADGPTTGGYPKIATVVAADLPRLAQLVPGEGEIRFEAVTIEEAQA
jgi:KipI family sensor histidine kinase inhibitor